MKHLLIAGLSLGIAFGALAHEGHDQAPGSAKAHHGGIVMQGKETNLEYVVTGSEVKLYPVDHGGKDVAADKIKVTATAKSSKGKAENLKLQTKEHAYIAKVDFKGAYRVEMNVAIETDGKKDNFKFQVEK